MEITQLPFPRLRADPMALSGASRRKQTPCSKWARGRWGAPQGFAAAFFGVGLAHLFDEFQVARAETRERNYHRLVLDEQPDVAVTHDRG